MSSNSLTDADDGDGVVASSSAGMKDSKAAKFFGEDIQQQQQQTTTKKTAKSRPGVFRRHSSGSMSTPDSTTGDARTMSAPAPASTSAVFKKGKNRAFRHSAPVGYVSSTRSIIGGSRTSLPRFAIRIPSILKRKNSREYSGSIQGEDSNSVSRAISIDGTEGGNNAKSKLPQSNLKSTSSHANDTSNNKKKNGTRKNRVSWSEDETKVDQSSGPSYNKSSSFRTRNMSRRTRNTFVGKPAFQMSQMRIDPDITEILNNNAVEQLKAKCLATTAEIEKEATASNSMDIDDTLSSVILKSFGKKSLCNVELVGRDGVAVDAPSYLLAAHSEVFESIFYSSEGIENPPPLVISGGYYESGDGGNAATAQYEIELPFAQWDAIEATMHFLATRTLPTQLESDEEHNMDVESTIRTMCQIHFIGRVFKVSSLTNTAYRAARLLMNKMPRLVCAAFDECIVSSKYLVEGDMVQKYGLSVSHHDELKEYALEYLRDSPLTTLLSGGTKFLTKDSIEEVICDHDMDVDELTMFNILNTWVKQDESENVPAAEALVSNINLSFIKRDHLNNVVRKCGFVDREHVDEALREIEEMLENQSPDEKEHVVVEGAGKEGINGIYVRMEDDIGLGGEEVMFVKECRDDEDYCPDYGLYLLRSTWAITSCVDYSNILYTCDVPSESGTSSAYLHKPPMEGWKTVGGTDPPPNCTWNPSKDDDPSKDGYVAPNLADVGVNKKCLSDDIANGDHDEGRRKRLTLRTMLNLPTDEGFEDVDYHDDIDDSLVTG